jgi:hypothetical protein
MSPCEAVLAAFTAYLAAGDAGTGPGDRAAQRDEFVDTIRAAGIPEESVPEFRRAITDGYRRLDLARRRSGTNRTPRARARSYPGGGGRPGHRGRPKASRAGPDDPEPGEPPPHAGRRRRGWGP